MINESVDYTSRQAANVFRVVQVLQNLDDEGAAQAVQEPQDKLHQVVDPLIVVRFMSATSNSTVFLSAVLTTYA